MIDARRSAGYARSPDNSCSFAAILSVIGTRETGITSKILAGFPDMCIVYAIRGHKLPSCYNNNIANESRVDLKPDTGF
jgi:hypothetical protein